jgi:hypothetical protein
MNIRNLRARIVSTMLAISVVVGFPGLGTHSALAQSITVTTPFPFCVNNQAYPKGRYEFTHISQWLLLIRDVNGGGESLFPIRPEDRVAQGLATGRARSARGVTFHTFQGFRELEAFDDPDSGLTVELIGQRISRDKTNTHGSLEPINCFNQKFPIRGRNTTGR